MSLPLRFGGAGVAKSLLTARRLKQMVRPSKAPRDQPRARGLDPPFAASRRTPRGRSDFRIPGGRRSACTFLRFLYVFADPLRVAPGRTRRFLSRSATARDRIAGRRIPFLQVGTLPVRRRILPLPTSVRSIRQLSAAELSSRIPMDRLC